MRKSDVIRAIFHQIPEESRRDSRFIPRKEKGLAYAPTNIALCKYWGKRDTELNLPVTSSLSIALPDKGAMTTLSVSQASHDEVILNDTKLESDSKFVKRLTEFLNLFRLPGQGYLQVDIKMNIPVATGLASSACGFASLVCALSDLFDWQLPKRELSILARLGSGSASRSLWNGFVEWHAGVQNNGLDSFAEPWPLEWSALCVGILPISEKEKSISSREAMLRTVNSSLLYTVWPKKVTQDLTMLKQAIQAKNFPLLGGTSESNALTMHATMLSSWPPVCYFLPETVASMHKVWELRQNGIEVYFTEDAGPNLKLLFLENSTKLIQEHFPDMEVIKIFPEI